MAIVHIHSFLNQILIETYDNIEMNLIVKRLEELKKESDESHMYFVRE